MASPKSDSNKTIQIEIHTQSSYFFFQAPTPKIYSIYITASLLDQVTPVFDGDIRGKTRDSVLYLLHGVSSSVRGAQLSKFTFPWLCDHRMGTMGKIHLLLDGILPSKGCFARGDCWGERVAKERAKWTVCNFVSVSRGMGRVGAWFCTRGVGS